MIDNYIRRAELVRVIDGDTVELLVDLGWRIAVTVTVRLFGVNTPEVRGAERPEGLRFKDITAKWFDEHGKTCWLDSREFTIEKYGRTLGIITSISGGKTLNTHLAELL